MHYKGVRSVSVCITRYIFYSLRGIKANLPVRALKGCHSHYHRFLPGSQFLLSKSLAQGNTTAFQLMFQCGCLLCVESLPSSSYNYTSVWSNWLNFSYDFEFFAHYWHTKRVHSLRLVATSHRKPLYVWTCSRLDNDTHFTGYCMIK